MHYIAGNNKQIDYNINQIANIIIKLMKHLNMM